MFSKVLVANRGEIAIRAFRAAYELGVGTVAVYPYEDRNSQHRLKADESYQIGDIGHPVHAYLSVDEIVATARRAVPTLSTLATGFYRRIRIWLRHARRRASASSVPAPKCLSWLGISLAPSRRPAKPACPC